MPPRRTPKYYTPSHTQQFYKQALAQILALNPLQNSYMELKNRFEDKAAASQAFDRCRRRIITTLGRALNKVFGLTDSEARVKIALIRRFVRMHHLAEKDGRKARGFWGKLDTWFTDKRRDLGETFATTAWQKYIPDTIEDDERYAPPSLGLFTWIPMHITPRSSVTSTASTPATLPSHEAHIHEHLFVNRVKRKKKILLNHRPCRL
ncbi:hypothetical protein B0H19DRAFT_1283803 [Mycena capillaripes]|nr:hypothetical protein B0H19DRAFT_1283803 [Mycena capillaripes]